MLLKTVVGIRKKWREKISHSHSHSLSRSNLQHRHHQTTRVLIQLQDIRANSLPMTATVYGNWHRSISDSSCMGKLNFSSTTISTHCILYKIFFFIHIQPQFHTKLAVSFLLYRIASHRIVEFSL